MVAKIKKNWFLLVTRHQVLFSWHTFFGMSEWLAQFRVRTFSSSLSLSRQHYTPFLLSEFPSLSWPIILIIIVHSFAGQTTQVGCPGQPPRSDHSITFTSHPIVFFFFFSFKSPSSLSWYLGPDLGRGRWSGQTRINFDSKNSVTWRTIIQSRDQPVTVRHLFIILVGLIFSLLNTHTHTSLPGLSQAQRITVLNNSSKIAFLLFVS